MNDNDEHVVLVVGSCGMDHLLTTTKYPQPDSKVRSVAYNELGGGNAANTASAMALLQDATLWTRRNIRIKFLTKIGDDHVGQRLVQELKDSNVDTSSVLFRICPGTFTSFTTVIVELENHTRTCIHTPGTCGVLTIDDCKAEDMDQVFENVVHLHSDSRHSEASLFLAREAKRRGVPVSVDCEKDRKTPSLDALMELSDVVFTNSNYLRSYLERLEMELEAKEGRMHLPAMKPVAIPDNFSKDTVDIYINSLGPSAFYNRWYSQTQKTVIVTHGDKGALHYQPISAGTSPTSKEISNNVVIASDNNGGITIEHIVVDSINGQSFHTDTNYTVHQVGVLHDIRVVDTTGAGDAFIGGYLMAQLATTNAEGIGDPTQFALEFASWVSARKLEGSGARSTLPKGIDVDTVLGSNVIAVKSKLTGSLSSFKSRNRG